MTPVILVPVKDPVRAKSRLSGLLTEPERCALAWAMLEDLIRVLLSLPFTIALVTNSQRAASRAADLGWRVFREENQISESASVDTASRILGQEGVEAVLRLPADIPLLQPADVAELLSSPIPSPGAVIAPARDRMGTNALLRTPPGLFPSCFGPNSFALHLQQAAKAGAHLRIVENPRLALDLDEISDVIHFLDQPADGETLRALKSFQIAERLSCHGAR